MPSFQSAGPFIRLCPHSFIPSAAVHAGCVPSLLPWGLEAGLEGSQAQGQADGFGREVSGAGLDGCEAAGAGEAWWGQLGRRKES